MKRHRQILRDGQGFGICLPGVTMIYYSRPEVAKQIFIDNFDNYGKGEFLTECFYDLTGEGIFNVDGDKWYHQRKTASRIFSQNYIRRAVEQMPVDKVKKILHMNEGSVVNMYDLFMNFTMTVFSQMAFGYKLTLLDEIIETGEIKNDFGVLFDNVQSLIAYRTDIPWWKILKQLDMGTEKILTESFQKVHKVIDGFVDHVQSVNVEELKASADLLSKFYVDAKEQGKQMTRTELYDVVLNFLLAGRDTTAIALTMLMYELVSHPKILVKLQNSLIDEFGKNFKEKLTLDNIQNLHYLDACIKESLRLHPPVPAEAKEALGPDVMKYDGTEVRKGDLIVINLWGMARLPEIWGEDAAEFNPKRFLDDPTPDDWKFLSFLCGKRKCIGKRLAITEIKIMMVHLLCNFDFEAVPDFVPKMKYGLTAVLKDPGFCVKVNKMK